MRDNIWICFIFAISVKVIICDDSAGKKSTKSDCWMTLGAPELFRIMKKIDKEYASVRKEAHQYLEHNNFNKRMLEVVLINGNVSYQQIHKRRPHFAKIPSGTTLGGACMLKISDTVLFFHRMKVPHDAYFQVNVLHNDIENMALRGHLSMNGLLLKGGFESTITGNLRNTLVHRPTASDVQVIMEDIQYAIEGRYRLIKNRLAIEHIVSKLSIRKIMLKDPNTNDTELPKMLGKQNMRDFQVRLKTDLDKWVQDYFNSYLIVAGIDDVPGLMKLRRNLSNKQLPLEGTLSDLDTVSTVNANERCFLSKYQVTEIHQMKNVCYTFFFSIYMIKNSNEMSDKDYDKYKTTKLDAFMELALSRINKRIRDVGGDYIPVPKFKIVPAYGLTFEIYDGIVRGLGTMYKRSVATSQLKRENLRYVDTIIGFQDLTVSYKYEVSFPPGPYAPPSVTGYLTMSAKDLSAHLTLGLLVEPEVVEIDINFLNPPGAEAITVEGGASILNTNLEHVLHHQIATIMSNSLTYGVGLLRTLPRCNPFVPGIMKKTTQVETFNTQTSPALDDSDVSPGSHEGRSVKVQGSTTKRIKL